MKTLIISVAVVSLLALPLSVRGQADTAGAVTNTAPVTNAMPTGDFGFNLPTHLGTLSYSLSGSELLETGYGASVATTTALSGNLGYISRSEQDPFSMVFSGGYLFVTGEGSPSSAYSDLALSQVLRTRSWTYVISDAVSYLPNAPTTGLSGVPGVGDVGTPPVVTGIGPAQDILSNYSNRLANGLTGSATWQIGASLDLEGSASWDLIHYTGSGNPGIDSNSYSGSFGPNYRIDARNSVGGNVYYSYSTYPTYVGYKIETEGANLTYNRSWTRRFSTTLSFGPETTHGTTFSSIPASINVGVSATANYATRTTGISASYTRAVNAGSGVIFGAISDTVGVVVTRPLSRDWQLRANGDYSRSVGLVAYQGVVPRYDSVFAAAQLSRRLTEALSCYGSYTVLYQSSQNSTPGYGAFNGTNNVIGFGITFAPAPLLSGR